MADPIIPRRDDRHHILFSKLCDDLIQDFRHGKRHAAVPGKVDGGDIDTGAFGRKHIFKSFFNAFGHSSGSAHRHDLHTAQSSAHADVIPFRRDDPRHMGSVSSVIHRISGITAERVQAVFSAAQSCQLGILQPFVPHDVLQILMGVVDTGVYDGDDDFLCRIHIGDGIPAFVIGVPSRKDRSVFPAVIPLQPGIIPGFLLG